MATSAFTSADALPVHAGVYVAKPQQLLIGPLAHLEHFVSAAAGTVFAGSTYQAVLPPSEYRYVVDCGPHLSDLPTMPPYATVPSPIIAEAATPAPQLETPISTRPSPPTDAVAATAASSTADALCPATMTLHATPDAKASSILSSDGISSAAPSPLPSSMSTSEAVTRMNRNAAECLERLRQRCVQNGMSTAAFAPARQVASASFAPLSQTSSASSPPCVVAPNSLPTSAANMAHTGPPTPTAVARAPVAVNGIAVLPSAKVELVQQAKHNDVLSAMAKEKLGADHVLRCLIPNTDNSLSSAAVQETIQQIFDILQANPEAQVYIYSLDGKGTASALAALYLLEKDRVALSEVLLQRLPACTPRMSCLVQLLTRDPHPDTFDKSSYLRLYLARRYPAASASSIEAAVSTCKGSYTKAEHLVRQELSFQRVDDAYLPSRETRRSSSTRASSMPSLTGMSSAQLHNNTNINHGSHCFSSHTDGQGDASFSDFSLCSSFVKDPVRLTEGDEKTVDSLYRALADGRVGVSREEVRESYIAHRRSQDLVLRQFLLRFRASEAESAPAAAATLTTVRPSQSYGSANTYSGCVTPTMELAEEISLPHFAAQSASRRGSVAFQAATPPASAMKRPSAELLPSPEPAMPTAVSLFSPGKVPAKGVAPVLMKPLNIRGSESHHVGTPTPTPTTTSARTSAATSTTAVTKTRKNAARKKTPSSSPATGSNATPKAKGKAPSSLNASVPSSKKKSTAPSTLKASKPAPRKKKECV